MTYKIVPRFIPIDKPSRISPIVNRPVFERIIVRLRLVFLIIPLIFRSVAFSCPVVDATPLPFVQVERGKIYSRSRCREFFFFVRFFSPFSMSELKSRQTRTLEVFCIDFFGLLRNCTPFHFRTRKRMFTLSTIFPQCSKT